MPINVSGSHWIVAVINNIDEENIVIQMYDSMNNNNEEIRSKLKKFFALVNENAIITTEKVLCPRQSNGIDCGLFAIMFAIYASLELPLRSPNFAFSQADIQDVRKWVAQTIYENYGIPIPPL